MDEEAASTDALVARIAESQHGVVDVGRLRAVDISQQGQRLEGIRAGRLHRLYRGVYAVGHPGLSDDGRSMAAVLARGAGAVLSHRSAAELWGLLAGHSPG